MAAIFEPLPRRGVNVGKYNTTVASSDVWEGTYDTSAPVDRKITISNLAKTINALTEDDLWDKMYIKAKSVIIQCRYCNSHNAISNPTCVQCGAPMGGSTDGR